MVFDFCRGLCYCLLYEKINIALIGCGFLGQRHLKTLHALRHKANIVAICDNHLEHAKSLGRQYHLPVLAIRCHVIACTLKRYVLLSAPTVRPGVDFLHRERFNIQQMFTVPVHFFFSSASSCAAPDSVSSSEIFSSSVVGTFLPTKSARMGSSR